MIYVWIFLIAFFISISLSPASIRISRVLNIFSIPKKGEKKGKPCLGGIGIYMGFVTACALAYALDLNRDPKLTALVFPSGLMVLLGLIDDAKDLRPLVKIIAELIIIGFLITLGIVTKITFLSLWLNVLLTVVWILFITNAFNLLDIVDGLSSGLVIVISLTLLVISLVNKDVFSSMVLTALIGANLGFLRYNYPPARLYMGDTGSLFSGFLLAAIAINISYAPMERPVALITPVLAMSLPIYDTFFLVVMRAKKRKPIFDKTNDHFALRLVTMGYGVRRSLWIMYLFSIFLAVSSLAVAFGSNAVGIIVLVMVALVFIFMGKKTGMVKIDD